MPALQSLVLKDREATPVNHTFNPKDMAGNVGTVAESTGVKIGDNLYSVSVRKTAAGKYKCQLKMVIPVVVNETINGVTVPAVSRTSYVNAEFTFDPTSTTAERNNVVGMFADSLTPSKTLVNDAVVGLQGVWG